MSAPVLGCWNVRGLSAEGRVSDCFRLIQETRIDLLCLLETKIGTEISHNPFLLKKFNLFNSESQISNFESAVGGRIWIKWCSDKLDFKPLIVTAQVVHGIVTTSGNYTFYLSCIYAENTAQSRLSLWNVLRSIGQGLTEPWILMGDFNCCLSSHEKSGGLPISLNNSLDFKECVNDCELIELPSSGLFYTWSNQQSNNPILSRIDRVLCNSKWFDLFPLSHYKVVAPLSSDHSPLITTLQHCYTPVYRFMYRNHWSAHEDFKTISFDAWRGFVSGDPMFVLSKKLSQVKMAFKMRKWDPSPLHSQIMQEKRMQDEIMSKLNRDPGNKELMKEANDAKMSYTKLLKMESIWAKQRAKAHWLSQSDDDLKFLFCSIKERRNANRIHELHTEQGVISNQELMAEEINRYYANLFNCSNRFSLPMQDLPLGETLSLWQANELEKDISDEEITSALHSINENKTPGPDGFNSHFFINTWEFTGKYFLRAAHHFFSTKKLPRCFKHTLLTLIPKVKHSSNISDYRPISLCNIFYKVIAKVLANRLKTCLPMLINNAQSAFIKGRDIADSLALANEISSEFSSPSQPGTFLAKLDLKKAFDSINREALIHRLLAKGIPMRFVKWVEACIMDVPFSVVLNGEIKGWFSSSSGLRQGCPLSPFLFTIAIETLSCLLERETQLLRYTPCAAKLCKVSHLLFADDVLAMGKAENDTIRSLQGCLTTLENYMGLKVNIEKSTICFSKGVKNAEYLLNILNITQTFFPINYLGLPVVVGAHKTIHFNGLFDKLQKRMAGWKSKFLSLGGRYQMIRSSVNGLLSYWFRSIVVPKGVLKKICSFTSNFFYHSGENKKLHTISWLKTTLPREKGGTGLISAYSLYTCSKLKIIWRVIKNDSLFASWCLQKYGTIWETPNTKCTSSWKELRSIGFAYKTKFKYLVGNGNTISLFQDPWCNGNTIANLMGELAVRLGISNDAKLGVLLSGMDLHNGSSALSFINQYGSKLMKTHLMHRLSSPRDSIALTLGVFSVISWGIAEVPQIITTYREKSIEGFSVGFLMAWIVGDIFNLVGCLLEPATLPTQFYMALLYTATTAILTAQVVYYSRLKTGKVCQHDKIEEREHEEKEKLIGKNSDERGSKMHEYKGSDSLLAGCNMPSSPIPVASPIGSYGSTGRDLYYRSARFLSTSPMPTVGSLFAHVRDPLITPPNGIPHILTEDEDSSSEPLLGSLSSSHDGRAMDIKNTLCVVSSAAFFVGLYVVQLPLNGVIDTKPRGLVIPIGRKLLQHSALESVLGEHVGSSGIGSFLGWAMAAIYMGGRLPQIWLNIRRGNVEGLSPFMFIFALVGNSTYVGSILVHSLEWSTIRPNLPWLVDAGGCVLLDAFILIQFIYFNYRKAAQKAADVESSYA